MTGLLLAAGLALPISAGYAAVRRILGPARDVASVILRAGLAAPLGLGASSLLAYVWLVAGGALGRAYAVTDFLVLGGAMAALRPWTAPPVSSPSHPPLGTRERIALGVAGLAVAVAAVSFVQAVSVHPMGGWDAWAIWNNHARFLYRGGDAWKALFGPAMAFSHNEYPLLVPTSVARLWAYAGEAAAAPWLVAGAFSISTVLTVYGALAGRSGHVAAATATLLLLATGSWTGWAPAQYADVPLACFVTAAVACLVPVSRDEQRALGAAALAGALLGLAAWTKDEGVVLMPLFAVWAALVASRPSRRRALAVASGAVLPLAVRIHFQLALAPTFSSTVSSGQTADSLLGRLVAAERWAVIGRELPSKLPGAEHWLPLVAVAAAAALGARWRELLRSPALPAIAAWAAFLLPYALTPADLHWHIATSASRVYLHAWPALLLGVFWLVPAPASSAAVPETTAATPGSRPA